MNWWAAGLTLAVLILSVTPRLLNFIRFIREHKENNDD